MKNVLLNMFNVKPVKFIVTVTALCEDQIATETVTYDAEADLVTATDNDIMHYCRSFGPIEPVKTAMNEALNTIAKGIEQ